MLQRCVILIDAENVGAQHFGQICAAARQWDQNPLIRIFGDFTAACLKPLVEFARITGVELRLQLSMPSGKNAADIALAVDAMDLLAANKVDTLCIASSDSDFLPLVHRIRASNVRAVMFGNHPGSALALACNTYVSLTQAARPDASTKAQPKSSLPSGVLRPPLSADERELLSSTIQHLAGDGSAGEINPAVLALALRKDAPALAARVLGRGRFVRTLEQLELVERRPGGTLWSIGPRSASRTSS